MAKRISLADFSRQQSAESFRNMGKLEDGTILKFEGIGEYRKREGQTDVLHYVEFSNNGKTVRMPMGDVTKHRGLKPEALEENGEEYIEFSGKYSVKNGAPRKAMDGEDRYPFAAYLTNETDKLQVNADIQEKGAANYDWAGFYGDPKRIQAAKDSNFDPIMDYEFSVVD